MIRLSRFVTGCRSVSLEIVQDFGGIVVENGTGLIHPKEFLWSSRRGRNEVEEVLFDILQEQGEPGSDGKYWLELEIPM